MEQPCFYSTYEELKLLIFGGFVVATTPFLQYLWGIETSSKFQYLRQI